MNRHWVVLVPLMFLLTACTPDGYPATDSEMWGMVTIFLGLFALVGFVISMAMRR